MLNAISVLLWTAFLIAGCILGWLIRASHSRSERAAINEGWREQLDAQKVELRRLDTRGKSLMQQVAELQGQNRDLTEANQRQAKALETSEASRQDALRQLDALTSGPNRADPAPGSSPRQSDGTPASPDEHERIAWLENELNNWQQRLPPLIDKFRERDAEAKRLAVELEEAQALLQKFEAQPRFDETRASELGPGDLDGVNEASNDTTADDDSDLLQIKGIGPAISTQLSDLGFDELEKLAYLSSEDEQLISSAVRGAAAKIADWKAQALALIDADRAQ